MILNIIGNGFDLYHGLPSGYYHFACYLIEKDPEFYDEIVNMFNLGGYKKMKSPIEDDFVYVVEEELWKNFEKNLGNINEYSIVGTHVDDLRLENDDPVDLQMNDDIIAENLKKAFTHWVRDTLDKKENYDLILEEMKEAKEKVNFSDDEYFLEFNYTHTLQNIYKISEDRIHYVHGECLGNDNDELIIGHGNDYAIEDVKDKINILEDEYDYTQSSLNERDEYTCLLNILRELRKDVNICKSHCQSYYNRIEGDIDLIRVFGLSLGEVDMPYLQQIKEKWPEAKWEFAYYNEADITNVNEATKILNINEKQYDLFKFSNEHQLEILNKIISLQGITEYEKVNKAIKSCNH